MGKVTVPILRQVLGETWTESQKLDVMKECDANGDGRIDFEELYRWLCKHATVEGKMRLRSRDAEQRPSLDGVPPQFLDLLETLNTDLGHRADIVTGEKEALKEHLISTYTIMREWGASEEG